MNIDRKELYKEFLSLFYNQNVNLNEIKNILEKYSFANGLEDDTISQLPIYLSLINKREDIAKTLLEYGADINKSFGYITNNFIYGEDDMYSFHMPIISHLIQYQSDNIGSIANSLKEATKMLKDTKEIEFLINNNCDINKTDIRSYTPLDRAYSVSHLPAIRLLKKYKAKHSKRFIEKKAHFHFNNEQISKLDYLDIPYIDKSPPPFHLEIQRTFRNYKINREPLEVGFLLGKEEKHDKNQKDWKGRTPLDFALEIGHHVAVEYLKSIGAKTSSEL
ncbi:MAG: hypothetical protein U0457_03240 [Candidatus Sericytochromatia bacterium]